MRHRPADLAVFQDQVGDEGLFVHRQLGVGAHGTGPGALDFPPRAVGVVDNAVAAVAAFAAEGEVKTSPQAGEPLNGGGCLLNQKPYGLGVGQTRAGHEGVFFVQLPTVAFPHGGGDAALRPTGVAIGDGALGENGHPTVGGGAEGKAKPGQAAADHDEVERLGSHEGCSLS